MVSSLKFLSREKKRTIVFVVGALVIFALAFVLFYYLFRSWGTIEYQGLVFTKEAYGNLTLYHYYYYFNDAGGQIYKNNVWLRHDPRLNKIPREGEIIFPEERFAYVVVGGDNDEMTPARQPVIYLSINSSRIKQCADSVIAVPTLSGFLANNLFRVASGTPDQEEARARDARYVTCTTHPDAMVILLAEGNQTRIVRTGERCYAIEVAQCQIQEAVEKFIVEALIDARRRAAVPTLASSS